MDWSKDFDVFKDGARQFCDPGSNMVLDFHGDPGKSDLIVFSDGNHNMALKETLLDFKKTCPDVRNYFYATTPPGPLVHLIRGGRLQLGNLSLQISPHVFIGPPKILSELYGEGLLKKARPFVRNQGSVLLVKKDNPKKIQSVDDLSRPDVVIFLSNPVAEKASFTAYMQTLKTLSNDPQFHLKLNIRYGRFIHHREAPAAIADNSVDATIIFYHLGLHFCRTFPQTFEIIPLGGTIEEPEPVKGNIIGNTAFAQTKRNNPFADRFVEFLSSRATADIYRRHGLIPLF